MCLHVAVAAESDYIDVRSSVQCHDVKNLVSQMGKREDLLLEVDFGSDVGALRVTSRLVAGGQKS